MAGPATMEIALDDAVAEAGSYLKGTLVVQVQEEIVGTQTTIKFSGMEDTKVQYTVMVGTSDLDRRMDPRYTYGSRNIVSCSMPVSSSGFLQGQSIAPGQYKIPFALELPSMLPSTMEEYSQGGFCRVKYKMEAILEGSGVLWNYNCFRDVLVRAKPVDVSPLAFNQAPYTEQINFCCCFGSGSIAFGVMVDDTRLGRGETAKINLSIRNHTTAQIQSINAVLTQYISWSAGSHRSSTSQELVRVDFGPFKGDNQQRSTASAQELDDIFREMKEGVNARSIQVPSNALNSFKGALMEISHKLEIVADIGYGYDSPTITLPVQIGEPAISASPAVTNAPADTTTLANTIRIPSSHAIVGGPSVENETEGEVPAAPLVANELEPSLNNLLVAMNESIDDALLIESKASLPSWRPVFESLEPGDLKEILKQVDSDFDETRVAEAVAQHMGSKFTCAYVVAALTVVAEWNRTNIVERLLQYCTDLKVNQGTIKSVLSEWEKLVTQSAFDNALK